MNMSLILAVIHSTRADRDVGYRRKGIGLQGAWYVMFSFMTPTRGRVDIILRWQCRKYLGCQKGCQKGCQLNKELGVT